MIRRALISVSNKTGIVPFAKALQARGVEIISTGGTAQLLAAEGIPHQQVQDITGFPEMLDGRVKTLHPAIHGGLLARRDLPEHMQALEEHGIKPIDLVVVNLYPFVETIQKPDATLAMAIENIDIGGPSMLRSAAKNYDGVVVVVNPERYDAILQYLDDIGTVPHGIRLQLAEEVFRYTSFYDAAIANYLRGYQGEEGLPDRLTFAYRKERDLRYGENPHQVAAFYHEEPRKVGTLASSEILWGKALSYNNLGDTQAALSLVTEFEDPCVVAVKHQNPCGVGIGSSIYEAFQKAYAADPKSIFGGILALNRLVDLETAKAIRPIFLEVIVAPGYTEDALRLLKEKKDLRLLSIPQPWESQPSLEFRAISGGLLVQTADKGFLEPTAFKTVTRTSPTAKQLMDLHFAWRVVKHVKSNAIVVAAGGQTLGIGPGQTNRVDAAMHAIERAGAHVQGAVLASDAFFPFADTVDLAGKAGIKAIIQPGGSIRDAESIEVANQYGMAMVVTGVRHFLH